MRTIHIKGCSIHLTNSIRQTTKAVLFSFSIFRYSGLKFLFSWLFIYAWLIHKSWWIKKHRKNLKYAHKISNKLPKSEWLNGDETKNCENRQFNFAMYSRKFRMTCEWEYRNKENHFISSYRKNEWKQ